MATDTLGTAGRGGAAIAATDPGDLARPAVDELRRRGHAVDVVEAGRTPEEVAAEIADATIVLAGIVPLPASALARLRATRLIVRCGAGVDSVDVAAATERGVWVANVPDYCVEEVADHTLLLLLAAARHVGEFRAQLDAGSWTDLRYPQVRRIRGRTLGLIGFGRIGSRVAVRARAFGLEVLVHDPFTDVTRIAEAGARSVELETLLEEAQLISLHVPLTPATRHLLGAEAFARMQPGVVLVNTSRGALVDLDALEAAFEAGTVAAAGLDVVDGEPRPHLDHPVLRRPSVFVTPHISFYSVDAQQELGQRVADEVERFLDGRAPTTLVNPTARTGGDP